jgi:GGDEF domain-containing protein
MLDIDGFKTINDRVGHLGGDEILSNIGVRLKHVLRSSDVRGRFGGDEFVIVLPDTPAAGAAYVAEALRREIETLEVLIEGAIVRSPPVWASPAPLPEELDPNALVGPDTATLRRQNADACRLRGRTTKTVSAAPAGGARRSNQGRTVTQIPQISSTITRLQCP